MKIVLAFDSFKGCMTADEACHTAAQAIREVLPYVEIVECPLSDGGEGLVDCVEKSLPVERVTIKAHDPLMNIIDVSYVIDSRPLLKGQGSVSYMEMSATCGLTLVPKDKRNPMNTTTYGVGDMIIDATRRGCKEIVIGIGGSATCDAGKGMIQCLKDSGFKLPSDKLPHVTVASDVTNPLYGEQGAAYIFAPQKGATPEQVVILDEQLRAFARETEKACLSQGQDQSRLSKLADYPGVGAAGGLGYGLMAYLNATLKSGIDIILDIKDFNKTVNDATIIITGEGKSDEQTIMGKVPYGVLKRVKERHIPVWLISGCIDDKDGVLTENFDLVKSINDGDNRPLEVLLQPSIAKENLKKTIQSALSYNLILNSLPE